MTHSINSSSEKGIVAGHRTYEPPPIICVPLDAPTHPIAQAYFFTPYVISKLPAEYYTIPADARGTSIPVFVTYPSIDELFKKFSGNTWDEDCDNFSTSSASFKESVVNIFSDNNTNTDTETGLGNTAGNNTNNSVPQVSTRNLCFEQCVTKQERKTMEWEESQKRQQLLQDEQVMLHQISEEFKLSNCFCPETYCCWSQRAAPEFERIQQVMDSAAKGIVAQQTAAFESRLKTMAKEASTTFSMRIFTFIANLLG